LCKTLKVSKNAFYHWLKRKNKKNKEKEKITKLIKKIFYESRGTYGSRRIKIVLEKEYNLNISRRRISRIMKENGLKAKTKRKKKIKTTTTKKGETYAENIIKGEFSAKYPNQKYSSDITYVKIGGKYKYFYVSIDYYSRKIISHYLSENLRVEGAIEMIKQIEEKRGNLEGVIFHSDRGVQYSSKEFKAKLNELGIKQSMSGKGNCYDNAVAESFFSTLKTELGEEFTNEYTARLLIDEYINWYNSKRLHSALGYKTPLEVEYEYFKSLCTK